MEPSGCIPVVEDGVLPQALTERRVQVTLRAVSEPIIAERSSSRVETE
jgi:hypothetical protein